jgi:hypothetical protein
MRMVAGRVAVFPHIATHAIAYNQPTSCYLICSIVAGPSPVLGSIFQGHAFGMEQHGRGQKDFHP